MWKNNPQIIRGIQPFAVDGFIISATTEAELLVGALDKADLQKIQRDLQLLETLPLQAAIGALANSLLATYTLTLSNRLSLADALIAATALHHGLPLYTLNRKDFRYLAGLQLHAPT